MLRIGQGIKQTTIPPYRELAFFDGDKQFKYIARQINTTEKNKVGKQ